MEKRDYNNALTLLEENNELKELKRLKNEILEEWDKLNNGLLTENERLLLEVSFWDKTKYFLSKLGRYKAGGKIFGKGKVDQEAKAKIQKILDKKGNELIKNLHDEIQRVDSEGEGEFPNNQDPELFLNVIELIAATYDSIIESTKKKPKEKGFLPIDAANSIITDLREYVRKYLDVDLSASYTVMDSEEEETEELITDSDNNIEEDRASDLRKKLQGKKGKDAEKVSNIRMGKQGLSSNKLPMMLAGIGASMGAFSWLTNTEWFKSLFQESFQYTDTQQVTELVKTKTEVLHDIKPGEGVYKLLNRTTDINVNASSDPQDFIKQLSEIGGGDPHAGIDQLCEKGGVMMRPDDAAKGLHDLVNNPGNVDNMGEFFKGGASGTGKLIDPGSGMNTTLYGTVGGKQLSSLVVKMVPKLITKTIIKTGVRTTIGYTIAKGLGGILGPLGIGLVAAGGLVKLMRMKGKKQSRAKTLDDLLQSLQYAEETDDNKETDVIEPKKDDGGNNLCSKNVDELNGLLKNTKKRANALKSMKLINYSDNKMFQKMLLDNFLNSKVTSIKINGKPIVVTLKQLYDNGLLEAPRSRDMNKKQQLPSGWENQLSSFFTDLFKMFSLLNKSCKNNPVYTQTKKLFKQLYIISREGKGSVKDEKKRAELFKKLVGSLHNFFSAMTKVQDFTKGKEGKPSDEEIEKRRAAKERGRQRQDKAGEDKKDVKPELAHYDRGDSLIKEEVERIRQLMK